MDPLDSLPRLPGWEGRLAALIESLEGKPYQLGTHDCFRVACAVIQALVGVDRWSLFAGHYASRRECLALLAEWGSSFSAAGDRFFGSPAVSWKLARRGDLLEWRDSSDQAHLVVCNGANAVGLLPDGPVTIPLHLCAHCWRVG